MADTENLSDRLKDMRIARDWTIEHVAQLVGISTTAIWNIENGRSTPNDRTLYKLKKAFPHLF